MFQTVDATVIVRLPENGAIKGATFLIKGNGPSKDVIWG
jgi:hypothetical protein